MAPGIRPAQQPPPRPVIHVEADFAGWESRSMKLASSAEWEGIGKPEGCAGLYWSRR